MLVIWVYQFDRKNDTIALKVQREVLNDRNTTLMNVEDINFFDQKVDVVKLISLRHIQACKP